MKGNHSRIFILFRCSWGQGSRKCGFPKWEGIPFRDQACKEAGSTVLSVNLSFTASALCVTWGMPLHLLEFVSSSTTWGQEWGAHEITACSFCLQRSFSSPSQCLFAWLIPASYSRLRWNVSSELRPTLTTPTTGQVAFHSVCVALPAPGPHVPFWSTHPLHGWSPICLSFSGSSP